MSGPRRWLATLLGMTLLALSVRVDAVDPAGPAIGVLARAGVQDAEPAPGIPMEVVTPGQPPPDESLRVRVVPEGDAVEGSPLRFRVLFPDRFDPAGLELTYAVDQPASESVDNRGSAGPVIIDPGSDFGTFEIATLHNPASGGAKVLVQVRLGDQVAGRAIGTIIDRPPPRVEVTSAPALEGDDLVFEVTIDPAAEVRGPWTYIWRLESADAVEGASALAEEDYEPRTGTLRFDAEGRPLDEVRIRTRQNDSSTEPRTLRLIVSANEVDYGSGLGMIEDRPADAAPSPPPPLTPAPEPEPPPGWDWTLIAIGMTVLVILTIGAWRMLRPTPSPVVTDGSVQDMPREPLLPELVVATSSGPRMFEPTELGLPELVIETKAGPAVFTPPARLPVESVGEKDG